MDARTRRPRVIALMNQKGGVGKTTTTVNLAAAIARQGRRVLVVDLDPQAHATLHLGVEPEGLRASVYDAMMEPETDAEELVSPINPTLSVMGSETDLAAAEVELTSEDGRHLRLRRVLERLSDRFDYVLIDCPPSLGLLTLNGLCAADEVVIPMQAQFLALQGVGKLLETVRLVTGELNPRLRVAGIILCMFDSQTTHAQEVVADLEDFFGQQKEAGLPWSQAKVYQPPVRRNIKVAECPSFGKTIFEYSPWAAGAQDYSRLAEAFLAEREGSTGRQPDEPASAEATTSNASDAPQASREAKSAAAEPNEPSSASNSGAYAGPAIEPAIGPGAGGPPARDDSPSTPTEPASAAAPRANGDSSETLSGDHDDEAADPVVETAEQAEEPTVHVVRPQHAASEHEA